MGPRSSSRGWSVGRIRKLIVAFLFVPMLCEAGQNVLIRNRVTAAQSVPVTINPFTCSGGCSITVTAGERLYVVTGYMNTSNTACNLSDSQSNTFTLLGTSSSLNPSFGQLNVYETIPSSSGSDSLTLNTSPCYAIGATITGSGSTIQKVLASWAVRHPASQPHSLRQPRMT